MRGLGNFTINRPSLNWAITVLQIPPWMLIRWSRLEFAQRDWFASDMLPFSLLVKTAGLISHMQMRTGDLLKQ